jgi:hypothetical protein
MLLHRTLRTLFPDSSIALNYKLPFKEGTQSIENKNGLKWYEFDVSTHV